ncbi:hypothetical protein N7492_010626 [Penicillium capsulatum]|uniref:Zn(2)-C6 fungal-type domain-containing protein n=1 Tax=Penicillium capsulatum TaxID=69766 RepID=A0A9W9LE33_9EURO|nr:hypothetical protein N7492_010626 [Penicillium capsulatum]KAJ6113125.1 hypothetical protein N7512_008449 [Penicillium capsulatum]
MNPAHAKKTRGKNGCRTCRSTTPSFRIRRIKCDEGRPSCRRCTSTGRSCDGYEVASPAIYAAAMKHKGNRPLRPIPTSHDRHLVSVPKSVLSTWTLSAIEAQGFIFFREHSAQEISGCFNSTIWNQLVLQLSHIEPCILHATIAVGAMHRFTRGYCPSLNAAHYLGHGNPLAIQQYIKSLYHLRERLKGPKDLACEQVALMTCLLFICLEMLQGNRAGALAHLQSGLRILAGLYPPLIKVDRHQNTIMFQSTPDSTTSASSQLAVIFARLDYESTMFGQQSPALTFVSPESQILSTKRTIPERFSTIEHARQFLDTLANAVLGLRGRLLHLASQSTTENIDGDLVHQLCANHARARTIDLTHHQDITHQQSTLQTSLERWAMVFKLLVRTPRYTDSQPAITLELQHFYLYFLASTFRNTHETHCNRFSGAFRRVTFLAEKLIGGARDAAGASTFTLESGIIPSLYLTAMKCRDSRTRNKAIALLEQTTCQEGMWEGALIARFVAEMARLEEQAAGAPDDTKRTVASDVPESARFCDVVMALSERIGHGRLVCARYRHESTGDLQVLEKTFVL